MRQIQLAWRSERRGVGSPPPRWLTIPLAHGTQGQETLSGSWLAVWQSGLSRKLDAVESLRGGLFLLHNRLGTFGLAHSHSLWTVRLPSGELWRHGLAMTGLSQPMGGRVLSSPRCSAQCVGATGHLCGFPPRLLSDIGYRWFCSFLGWLLPYDVFDPTGCCSLRTISKLIEGSFL